MEKQKKSCLVLTALEQYWPEDKHIVFLGDWCQKNTRKEYWEKLDYELAADIWEDPEFIRYFDRYCLELIERLVSALTNTLNEIHGENHSASYWKVILIQWLYYYIYEWYGHYQELVSALEQYPDIDLPVLVYPDTLHPISRERIRLQDGRGGEILDLYHYFIYSKILKSLSKERSLNLVCCDVPANFFMVTYPVQQVGTRFWNIKKFLKRLYRAACGNAPIVCFGFHAGKELSELRRAMLGKVCFLDMIKAPIEDNGKNLYDLELRKRLNIDFTPKDEFERVILENIVHDLPVTAIERYKVLVEFKKKNLRYIPEIVILPGVPASETAIYMAEWLEKGTDIYCIAHSPVDSIMIKNYTQPIFLSKCKKYAWGYAGDIRSRCCPSFKTYENEVKSVPIGEKSTILWCGSGLGKMQRYMTFVGPIYRTRILRQHAIDSIKDCLSALKKDLLDKLLLRPRDTGAYGIIELFRDYVPNVEIDLMVENAYAIMSSARASLYERFNESRIVICESLCTAVFYEALYSDIPVIVIEEDLYSDIQDYLYDDVLPYFYELKQIGIWYESGQEAAEFLNENYESLESWWMEPERQKVRRKVVDRFFMNTDNLTEWWKQEFEELLKQRKQTQS